jgi:hypothetical protein
VFGHVSLSSIKCLKGRDDLDRYLRLIHRYDDLNAVAVNVPADRPPQQVLLDFVQDDLTIGQSVLHVQGGSPVIGHGLEGVFRPNEAAVRITGNATKYLRF